MTSMGSPSRRGLLRLAAGLGFAATGLPRVTRAGASASPARPEDTASIDAVLAALYDVISGPKGKARDWERFRGLFAPGARLIPCRPKTTDRPVSVQAHTPEEFAEKSAKAIERTGFYEREVSRKVDRFGHIAQVFSTYESRTEPGAAPFARGINSIQLFWDESRWWVVTIFWDAESPASPIPQEYLPRS